MGEITELKKAKKPKNPPQKNPHVFMQITYFCNLHSVSLIRLIVLSCQGSNLFLPFEVNKRNIFETLENFPSVV